MSCRGNGEAGGRRHAAAPSLPPPLTPRQVEEIPTVAGAAQAAHLLDAVLPASDAEGEDAPTQRAPGAPKLPCTNYQLAAKAAQAADARLLPLPTTSCEADVNAGQELPPGAKWGGAGLMRSCCADAAAVLWREVLAMRPHSPVQSERACSSGCKHSAGCGSRSAVTNCATAMFACPPAGCGQNLWAESTHQVQ